MRDGYVEVRCVECGVSLGYVVEDGHREWLCETCASEGEVVAVNLPAEDDDEKGTDDGVSGSR